MLDNGHRDRFYQMQLAASFLRLNPEFITGIPGNDNNASMLKVRISLDPLAYLQPVWTRKTNIEKNDFRAKPAGNVKGNVAIDRVVDRMPHIVQENEQAPSRVEVVLYDENAFRI